MNALAIAEYLSLDNCGMNYYPPGKYSSNNLLCYYNQSLEDLESVGSLVYLREFFRGVFFKVPIFSMSKTSSKN